MHRIEERGSDGGAGYGNAPGACLMSVTGGNAPRGLCQIDVSV